MGELVRIDPKFTRQNPSYSHPHKSHKKLVKVGRNKYLKINGGIHVVEGGPPYAFEYRKNLSKGKKRKAHSVKTHVGRSRMSAAALKAWATRRKRGH
jgi:hypothetical protein